MSYVLRRLKESWVESDFKMTEEALLSQIPSILAEDPGIKETVHKV